MFVVTVAVETSLLFSDASRRSHPKQNVDRSAAYPEVIDTSNMPALIEDTRPDPAVEYHQERQQTAYNEMVHHRLQLQRTIALVNYNANRNQNVVMEEVD